MTIWAFSLATMGLSLHSLTSYADMRVFGVWLVCRACAHYKSSSALPLIYLNPLTRNITASPKAISEKTSYYQARLAFHFLPQLIRGFCTTHQFGPSSAFRRTSSWSRQARSGFGSYEYDSVQYFTYPVNIDAICEILDFRAFNTWFPYGSA